MKWPGSPQRQQAGPGFPATLVAGSGTRNWRGDPGGTGISAELGLADPASLAWALPAADSGAGPPLHRVLQKSRNVMFSGTVPYYLFIYVFLFFQKSRNVMFSGTVPYYLFIYVFLLFPEVQKCYVFRHCARLFVYLFYCIFVTAGRYFLNISIM